MNRYQKIPVILLPTGHRAPARIVRRAAFLADKIGYGPGRRYDFIQGYVHEHMSRPGMECRYGRNAYAKHEWRRKMMEKRRLGQ